MFFGVFKWFRHFRILVLFAIGLMAACPRVEAQQGFGFSVTNSANSILVSNSLTYTINLTNLTGFLLADVLVTNLLPASVQPLSVTHSQGIATNIGSSVVFDLGQFPFGGIALLTLTVQPTAAGFITNMITVTSISVTNTASTNVVVQVTNIVIQADLGVTMTGSAQPFITNDWMTYGVTVTNAGPNAAPGVVLTNTLPHGVNLLSISPANQTYTMANGNLIFSLGTMAAGTSTNLLFTVEPTNPGSLTFYASVGAAGVMDIETNNNTASNNMPVISYPAGMLVAFTNSTQTINPQNGLEEQAILLVNAGTNDVAAARVVVTGLTRQLFNAVGTNDGNPFVTYATTLAAGKSVSLLLQFNPRGSFLFTNEQLHPFAVPLPNWTPPTTVSTTTNVNISRIVKMTNGNMLVEFPSTLGQAYTVVYSDNALFSNAWIAPPSVVAQANRMQWIDYGPPTTVSAPTNVGARFYRVFINP
jgi:uncharacterized repeat protein (TIGR01451 family)